MNPVRDGEQISILFVCLGNICRSPSAEGVMRHLLSERGWSDRFVIDSAGTHAYHTGNSPDHRAVDAAAERGIDLSKLSARAVTPDDFNRFDLILAMDDSNLRFLRKMQPTGSHAELRLLLDYCPSAGRQDVPDPYYGELDGFEQVLDLLEEASNALLDALPGKPV